MGIRWKVHFSVLICSQAQEVMCANSMLSSLSVGVVLVIPR